MTINWYPGHMKKHLDIAKKNIILYDVVLMVLDARLPVSSLNWQFSKFIDDKICIYIINKTDLVDKKSLKLWENDFLNRLPNGNYLFISTLNKNLWKLIENKINKIAKKLQTKLVLKKIMVLGIPNVGKSSLINKLAKKNSLAVANKPGLTQDYKFIKLTNGFEITDTPGILWPKIENEEDGYKLAIINAIKHENLNLEEILFFIINFFYKNYFLDMKKLFPNFTYLSDLTFENFIDFAKALAQEKHFYKKNQVLDLERTYEFLFKNLNKSSWFKYCLETPNEKPL